MFHTYLSLNLIYKRGALIYSIGRTYISETAPFTRLASILQYPTGIEIDRLISLIIGGLAIFGILLMRYYFLWWKIHPIGFLMTTSYATYCYWFSSSAPHPEDGAVGGLKLRVWRDGFRSESVAVVAKRYQKLGQIVSEGTVIAFSYLP